QIAPALLEALLRRTHPQALQAWTAPDDEHPVRGHAPALYRNAPVAFVGRDRNVSGPECPAFQPQQQSIEEIPTPEFCFIQFRIDVVMIEDELLAEQLEK